jgi:hypothetical protein
LNSRPLDPQAAKGRPRGSARVRISDLIRAYVYVLVRVMSAESGGVGSQPGSHDSRQQAGAASLRDLKIPNGAWPDLSGVVRTEVAGQTLCAHRDEGRRTAADAG